MKQILSFPFYREVNCSFVVKLFLEAFAQFYCNKSIFKTKRLEVINNVNVGQSDVFRVSCKTGMKSGFWNSYSIHYGTIANDFPISDTKKSIKLFKQFFGKTM